MYINTSDIHKLVQSQVTTILLPSYPPKPVSNPRIGGTFKKLDINSDATDGVPIKFKSQNPVRVLTPWTGDHLIAVCSWSLTLLHRRRWCPPPLNPQQVILNEINNFMYTP